MKQVTAVLLLASASALFSVPAAALIIDYDVSRAPELRACDDHAYRGREEQANECYTEAFSSASNNIVRAQAAWALRDLAAANVLFRNALQRDSSSVLTRIYWGRLFIATHQYDEALKLFREAGATDGGKDAAKLGMAIVYAERFEGAARKLVGEVLKTNPDSAEAHLLLARMDLEEGQLPEAEASLDRAQTALDKHKLPPLEVYALRAALDVHRGGDGSKWIKRALDYNPHYGGVYETLAHMDMIRRRYRESAEWLQKAVQVEPTLSSAHAELGANLLRLNRIEEGQKHLATAYEGDPYSVTTVNTLRLLDRFNEFDNIDAGSARLRLHRNESAILRPYVESLTKESIDTFAKRYKFTLQQPVTVELYPNHDDFAVRVGGLPGVGLLGVTFGYLLAMDSPTGRASGDFHWGSTLWHEMAHVFTLEATDHHVPRWLSEGISVFEEWRTGPTPGVVVTPDVIAALHEGKFLKIEDLDSGFIRPSYPNQVQVSYTQAGLICLFIEQRYGFDKLVALLEQFKRDVPVATAVKAALNMSAADFDKQFDAFVKDRYAKILPKMKEWQALYDAAAKAMQEERWRDVIEPARQSIELYSEHVGDDSPYLFLAQAYDRLNEPNRALQALLDYRKAGGWAPDAMRQLAEHLQKAGRDADAIDVLNAINLSDPMHADAHLLLADALLKSNQPQIALREYQALLALDTHDKATAYFGMARAQKKLGDVRGSRRNVLQALEVAPHFKPAQELLLDLVEGHE